MIEIGDKVKHQCLVTGKKIWSLIVSVEEFKHHYSCMVEPVNSGMAQTIDIVKRGHVDEVVELITLEDLHETRLPRQGEA